MKMEPESVAECDAVTPCVSCVYWQFRYRDRPKWKCPVRIKMMEEEK